MVCIMLCYVTFVFTVHRNQSASHRRHTMNIHAFIILLALYIMASWGLLESGYTPLDKALVHHRTHTVHSHTHGNMKTSTVVFVELLCLYLWGL